MSASALLSESELRERVERLAALERGAGSRGELAAAELIEAELRSLGLEVTRERETVHGGYWWPIGIATAAGALAGALGGRRGAVLGALAAAAVADDVDAGPRLLRRLALPKKTTVNLSAELGPPDAERTVVVVAHYDSAHSGVVFHPELPRFPLRNFPAFAANADTTPPTMWGAVGGPALAALGSLLGSRRLRLAGAALSAGYAAAMTDIGLRGVVPGANDNASGVAALLSLAHALAAEPPRSLRVILLFTGAEESLLEGMQRFGERHFASLPRDRTTFVCIDTVGSPHLIALEAEGMLKLREYPPELVALAHDAAAGTGVELQPGLRFRNSTDATVALKAGYPALMLGSVDRYKIPTDYHWPTDTPDRVRYRSVADAARLVSELLERLGEPAPQPSAAAGASA